MADHRSASRRRGCATPELPPPGKSGTTVAQWGSSGAHGGLASVPAQPAITTVEERAPIQRGDMAAPV